MESPRSSCGQGIKSRFLYTADAHLPRKHCCGLTLARQWSFPLCCRGPLSLRRRALPRGPRGHMVTQERSCGDCYTVYVSIWMLPDIARYPFLLHLRASSASSLSRSCRSLSLLISFSSWRYFRSIKRFWWAIWGKLSGTKHTTNVELKPLWKINPNNRRQRNTVRKISIVVIRRETRRRHCYK